jgi:CPA1 family monovalent cation:H+ antiporter
MDAFQVIAILVTLAALFNYLNTKIFKLPMTAAVMAMAMALSLAIMALGQFLPGLVREAEIIVQSFDFTKALMSGMLGLLLFAGALHVDLGDLTAFKGTIALLATVGVVVSTLLIGGAMWLVLPLFGFEVSWLHCLIFGALISPTDPIAVLGILKRLGAPPALRTTIAGESLFNDGFGVVVFLALLGAAGLGGAAEALTVGRVITIFAREALGGAVLGLGLGFVAYLMLRSIDDYQAEIMISLALVLGGYALASALHASGPIAMVVAGLLIGNRGRRLAMSDKTREHLDDFWELVDEILNAILFLLIGLEVLILPRDARLVVPSLVAIPIALAARFISVGAPLGVIGGRRRTSLYATRVLTWAGLRGGISVALALWFVQLLGDQHHQTRAVMLGATYAVVVFSILVQGMTTGPLLRHLGLTAAPRPADGDGAVPRPNAPDDPGAADEGP